MINKKYLIMRMKENLSLSEKINHTRCLALDISRSKYSWAEIKRLAKKRVGKND